MKAGNRKMVISIITAFVMAFAVIPYMGNSQVNAASDPYVWENPQGFRRFAPIFPALPAFQKPGIDHTSRLFPPPPELLRK